MQLSELHEVIDSTPESELRATLFDDGHDEEKIGNEDPYSFAKQALAPRFAAMVYLTSSIHPEATTNTVTDPDVLAHRTMQLLTSPYSFNAKGLVKYLNEVGKTGAPLEQLIQTYANEGIFYKAISPDDTIFHPFVSDYAAAVSRNASAQELVEITQSHMHPSTPTEALLQLLYSHGLELQTDPTQSALLLDDEAIPTEYLLHLIKRPLPPREHLQAIRQDIGILRATRPNPRMDTTLISWLLSERTSESFFAALGISLPHSLPITTFSTNETFLQLHQKLPKPGYIVPIVEAMTGGILMSKKNIRRFLREGTIPSVGMVKIPYDQLFNQ